jgi:cysteine desulfurase
MTTERRRRNLGRVAPYARSHSRYFCHALTPLLVPADARYKASGPVPESLFGPGAFTPGFTITGEALPGRASYLDMQATTPLDPRVLDAMLPWYTHGYGNPHSKTHKYGWDAEKAAEGARAQVAELIGASPQEIIFTSGATESNNMAVKGVARFYKGKKDHVITTAIEHKCVLDSCRALEQEGFRVTYLPVGTDGIISMADLEAAMTDKTALVSIMGVNNEIGVIQPLEAIGALCRKRKVFFHTDAAQMVGKLPVSVDALNIDLMSISGHKLYGPKGIGALYVRRKPRVRLEPLMSGGGQERGMRSGTLPHPLVVGLGSACAVAQADLPRDMAWVQYLSARLYKGITAKIGHTVLNGSAEPGRRYAGNLNISFAYVEGESLLMGLKNIAVSSGSACTSASLEPSYGSSASLAPSTRALPLTSPRPHSPPCAVLRAIGVGEDLAHTSIRFGLGRFTTEEEVDFVVEACVRHVNRLREMSPLWEMVQEGVDISKIEWTQDH